MKKVSLALLTALVLLGAAQAVTLTVETADLDVVGGHMQLPQFGGFRNSTYIDVQTRTSSFAYWGIARWDLTNAKAELDDLFGAGNWEITDVVLQMYRTRYTYSNDGYVLVRYTEDDASDFTQMANLTDGVSDPVGGQFVNDTVDTNGSYVTTIFYENDGTNYAPLQYDIFDPNDSPTAGELMMADDIRLDDTLTLAFVDDPLDFTVSAAWAGPGTSYAGQKPRLFITAKASAHVPVCTNRPSMDFNNDCLVTLGDFAIFISEWMTCGFADPIDCP